MSWTALDVCRKVKHNIDRFLESQDYEEKESLLDEILELTEFLEDSNNDSAENHQSEAQDTEDWPIDVGC